MIYLEEKLNIHPATQENRDEFIKLAEEILVPTCKRLGARLIAAWYGNYEWFSQIIQTFEFDDLESLKNFRKKASQDEDWGEYNAQLEEFAPERRTRLLEPIGAVQPEILHEAIEESQKSPLKVYAFAILEVASDQMQGFIKAVEMYSKTAPLIASWRPIAGSPTQVIDLWKGDRLWSAEEFAYKPALETEKGIMRTLRILAPKERIVPIYSLPYSPLK
ncbi:MAG: hypothetical protein ACXABO_04090 [Promethearchaeota archaeon]|jgi:hypothetical protein